MKNHQLIFLFFTLAVSSCTDVYWPELDKYENMLVVDGMITNEPGPYFIKLQTSSTLDRPAIQPLSNAEVSITDDLGNIEFFHEVEKGVYSNNSPEYQGEVGRSYQLSLSIPDSKNYLSNWEKLPPPVEINTIYTEIESHEISNNLTYPGLQFYIDTREASTDTSYLLWRVECTYKYTSDWKIFFYYDGNLHPFRDPDSLMTCWKTEPVANFFTLKLLDAGNKVSNFPLHFVSTNDRKLSIRYSVLIKQLSITETAFDYWNSLQKQEEIQGSLYSQQPYQIRGNMKNINNPDEPVLGFFLAAGISKERVFVDRPFGLDFYYGICELKQGNYEDYGRRRFLEKQYYPYYVTQTESGARAIPDEGCADCRETGGKIEKPDFWID